MSPRTIKELQFFVDKVCSIVTTSMNRSFDEQISREHFVIRVKTVNVDGIWGVHPYNHELVSFFSLPHIISIHQEVELDPNNPEHAAMIEEYEKRTGEKIKSDLKINAPQIEKEVLPVIDIEKASPVSEASDTGDATFIRIESLERLAEDAKKTFDVQDYFGKKI